MLVSVTTAFINCLIMVHCFIWLGRSVGLIVLSRGDGSANLVKICRLVCVWSVQWACGLRRLVLASPLALMKRWNFGTQAEEIRF